MTLDKVHIKWGAAAALGLLVLLWLSTNQFAPWFIPMAVGGSAFGWAVERYQAVRREGFPSTMDAVSTALPFWTIGALAEVVARL